MTILDMLRQSGLLTVLGMGVVFLFIIIMIISMHILHSIIHALKLDVEKKKESAGQVASAPIQQNNAVIAAIAAFLHKD